MLPLHLQAVPAVQALQELFAAATSAKGQIADQALAGLLDANALSAAAEGHAAPVAAVVVLVGSNDAQQLGAALPDGAGSLTLSGAEHEVRWHASGSNFCCTLLGCLHFTNVCPARVSQG